MATEINHIYKESTPEVDSMIQLAITQTKGKSCIIYNEKRTRVNKLVINQRHNIYTLDITLRNIQDEVEAYFCNGVFWSAVSKQLCNLI